MGVEGWVVFGGGGGVVLWWVGWVGGGGFPLSVAGIFHSLRGQELLRNCQRLGQLESPGGERRAVLYLYSTVATRRVVTLRRCCCSSGRTSPRK